METAAACPAATADNPCRHALEDFHHQSYSLGWGWGVGGRSSYDPLTTLFAVRGVSVEGMGLSECENCDGTNSIDPANGRNQWVAGPPSNQSYVVLRNRQTAQDALDTLLCQPRLADLPFGGPPPPPPLSPPSPSPRPPPPSPPSPPPPSPSPPPAPSPPPSPFLPPSPLSPPSPPTLLPMWQRQPPSPLPPLQPPPPPLLPPPLRNPPGSPIEPPPLPPPLQVTLAAKAARVSVSMDAATIGLAALGSTVVICCYRRWLRCSRMRRTRLVDEPSASEAGARVRTGTLVVEDDGMVEVELEQTRHVPERKQSPTNRPLIR